ncbi:hypothetical protein Tco_0087334 [Tanacetum coccineum]
MTQSEVGSSGWKSIYHRAVSGAPQAALENPEDRVPPTPGRTHNRIRSPRALNVNVKEIPPSGVNGGSNYDSLKGSKCLVINLGDGMEWINEIPTVPVYYPAKPQPRERAWQNQRGKMTLQESPSVDCSPPIGNVSWLDRRESRQGKSAKWIRNLGKRIGSEGRARGSQFRTRRLSVDCSSCSRGESGSPRAGRGTDWERPTQNCALNVKVKKFNQARVNGGSNYDSLKVAKCLVI